MRLPLPVHGALAVVTLVVGLAVAPQPASAQSLFDAMFGGPKPNYQPPNAYSGAQRLLQPNGINTGQPYAVRPSSQPRRGDDDGEQNGTDKSSGRGGHQTVCVRLCDGFYWPVSYSAPRSRFYRDANACQSSCGSEAKLFHYPTSGGKIEEAVDLTGRVYSRLPTAFKYRKALVQGCTCKPAPWSEAEIDRHRIYALNEEAAKGTGPSAAKFAAAPVPPPSGSQASAMVGDATDAVEGEPKSAPPAAVATDVSAEGEALPRKPARTKSTDAANQLQRNRSRTAAALPAVRVNNQQAQTTVGGFWNGGNSKYTWPGDAPARTR